MNRPHNYEQLSSKPLDLAIVTGFGDKGIGELKADLDKHLQLNSSRIISGTPWNKALEDPETIIANVSKELDAIPSENVLLIGHSYGALIALIIACRRRLLDIFKLVLIDGPLRSDVEVKPAKIAHFLFFKHYRERFRIAQECEDALRDLPSSKILTIGTAKDSIVPPDAKKLLSNELQVRLSTQTSAETYEPIMKGGTNILIDMPKMAGHSLTKSKAELYGKIIKNML